MTIMDDDVEREATEEEFIDCPEQALLELLERNELFGQGGIEVVGLACGRVKSEDGDRRGSGATDS